MNQIACSLPGFSLADHFESSRNVVMKVQTPGYIEGMITYNIAPDGPRGFQVIETVEGNPLGGRELTGFSSKEAAERWLASHLRVLTNPIAGRRGH
jgi:hypothetical protein